MEINKDKIGYILVNLLPYREKLKKEKLRRFGLINVFFGVIAIAILSFLYSVVSIEIEQQNKRNRFIEAENAVLTKQITEIADLKTNIKETLEKRGVVESLQIDRSDAVNILNYLTNLLPSGTSLKSINQKGDVITVIGLTQSNNKVSEYMTELEKTNFFSNAGLVQIKSVTIANKEKDKKIDNESTDDIFSEFTVLLTLNKVIKEAEEDKKPAKNSKKKK